MPTSLIVARMEPSSVDAVRRIFAEFDRGDMPHLMGTRRRQLFTFKGLYFHLQEFDDDDGRERIEGAKQDPRFVRVSEDLKAHIAAYDPASWKSPADAMAERFYAWDPDARAGQNDG
jgi:cyclase